MTRRSVPGAVLLDCHLHGAMRGHVFANDPSCAPKTDGDGMARFAGMSEGAAEVRA